jgi:hypothetical protein
MPGKRVQFDDETWNALDLLARDRMQDFQELADEAFRDLLEKHGRPTDLNTALRQSVECNQKPKLVEKQLPAPGAKAPGTKPPEGLRPQPRESVGLGPAEEPSDLRGLPGPITPIDPIASDSRCSHRGAWPVSAAGIP